MTAPLLDLLWSGEDIPAPAPSETEIFRYTRGPRTAKILVVGEAWGERERELQKPFVGASGQLLEKLLTSAGINPAEALYANLVNAKPNSNDMKAFLLPHDKHATTVRGIRPNAQMTLGLQKLDRLIDYVKPSLIIACGNWPLWWLTGRGGLKTERGYKVAFGIGNWAGSQLRLLPSDTRKSAGTPVLPILHPAAILRQYHWRIITECDLSRARTFLSSGAWDEPNPSERITLFPSPEEVEAKLTEYADSEITCDIETSAKRIHMIGFGRGSEAIVIPFFNLTAEGSVPFYSERDWPRVYRAVFDFLHQTSPGFSLVGQNFAYDSQYLFLYFGCMPKVSFDTMIAQHILFPALSGFKGLDSLSRFYCERHIYWKDERKESLSNADFQQSCLYNARDILVTSESKAMLEWSLVASERLHLFRERMELFEVCREMIIRGVRTNETLRQQQLAQVYSIASDIAVWLDTIMPESLKPPQPKTGTPWYRSPTQLSTLLHRNLKLQGKWSSETGNYTTNAEALVELGHRYPALQGLFSALILYRSLGTLASNYLSAPLGIDQRLHTSYNLAGPVTNRLSSSEDAFGCGANLQNIPRDRAPMELTEQDLL